MFDPVFGPVFFGKTISAAGIWIHNIVAAVLTYELTESALMVGVVTALQFAPQLVLAPFSGAMADRGHATTQIVIGRLVTAAGSGCLASWTWLGPDQAGTVAAYPIMLSSAVVGVGFVVGGPAMQSIVPSLVRRSELASAVTLNTVPPTAARAAGPVLGSAVALSLGTSAAFGVAALTSVVFGVIAWRVLPKDVRKPHVADNSVREGIRHLRRDPVMLLLLAGIAAVAFGSEPSITLAPAMSEALVGNTELTGWLASAFGCGAGTGFAVLALLRRRLDTASVSALGLGQMAAGLLWLTVSWNPGTAMIGFFLSGTGLTVAATSLATQIQERAPERLRGRIMALWLMASLGARPLAAAMNGLIADLASTTTALLTGAALVLATAYCCRPSRLRQHVPMQSGMVSASRSREGGDEPLLRQDVTVHRIDELRQLGTRRQRKRDIECIEPEVVVVDAVARRWVRATPPRSSRRQLTDQEGTGDVPR